MSRQIDYRSTSPHCADEVYATMVDPEFLRARLERIGGPGAGLLDHSADGGGARYLLRLGLDAKDLPSVVRSVLPGDVTIERNERWTRHVRADVTVQVPLIGGKIEGVVGEQVQKLLAAETAFTAAWLAGNGR